jgi:hypothetical protein
MRVIITGDRNWCAPELAAEVVKRLLIRYGRDLVIVHGGAIGIDRSFAATVAIRGSGPPLLDRGGAW